MSVDINCCYIIWEIGKVYGLPKHEIDFLVEGRGKVKPDNKLALKVMEVFNSLPKEFPNMRRKPLPTFSVEWDENFYDEVELIGFAVTQSYFDMLKEQPTGEAVAADLGKHVGKRVTVYGLFVTAKGTRTVHKETMAFGFFLDKDSQFIDKVHFPKVLAECPFHKGGVYRITGKVEEEFGFASITVDCIVRQEIRADPRFEA